MIKLFTDSASDLPISYYERNDIGIIPFYVTFDKQTYIKEHKEISVADFYKRLKEKKVFPSTSLPSAADYEDAFTPSLEAGYDIVCLCISSKFSGSYSSAQAAVESLNDKFPDRRICVIDSIQASGGQGLILHQLVSLINQGKDVPDIQRIVEQIKIGARVFLTVDTLEYLQKGGRIGKVSALAGTLLQIKPIIVMRDAELNPVAKIRGRKNAIDKTIAMTLEYVGDDAKAYDFIVLQADCMDEAQGIYDTLKSKGLNVDLGISSIGVTIGAHTGPGLLAIGLVKRV